MMTIAGLGLQASAQTFGFNEGDVILEGTLQFESTDNKVIQRKSSGFSVNPKAGYFLTDKTAVGLELGYGSNKSTNYSGAEETYTLENAVGAGLFVRHYMLEAGQRFKFYAEAGGQYLVAGGETKTAATTIKNDKTNIMRLGAGLGMNFFITEKIALGYALTDLISYESRKLDVSGAKPVNEFNVNLNSFDNILNAGALSLTFKL